MAVTGTWATVDDVLEYTGKTVTSADVEVAQTLIEGLIKRVYRASDADTSAYYWLSRAVAWQSAYVSQHSQILNLGAVQQLSQDGFSVTFNNNAADPSSVAHYYSPIALKFLDNLYRGANTTIRFNSAFQRRRLGVRWRAI